MIPANHDTKVQHDNGVDPIRPALWWVVVQFLIIIIVTITPSLMNNVFTERYKVGQDAQSNQTQGNHGDGGRIGPVASGPMVPILQHGPSQPQNPSKGIKGSIRVQGSLKINPCQGPTLPIPIHCHFVVEQCEKSRDWLSRLGTSSGKQTSQQQPYWSMTTAHGLVCYR